MQKSKAGLFLMELLIALLFFSIAGAVCLSLFVGAHTTNDLSQSLSHASVLLTNYCEQIYSKDVASDAEVADEIIYYDDSLNKCNEVNASFCLEASSERKDSFLITHIYIRDGENSKTLIEQDIKRYIRRDLSYVNQN